MRFAVLPCSLSSSLLFLLYYLFLRCRVNCCIVLCAALLLNTHMYAIYIYICISCCSFQFILSLSVAVAAVVSRFRYIPGTVFAMRITVLYCTMPCAALCAAQLCFAALPFAVLIMLLCVLFLLLCFFGFFASHLRYILVVVLSTILYLMLCCIFCRIECAMLRCIFVFCRVESSAVLC